MLTIKMTAKPFGISTGFASTYQELMKSFKPSQDLVNFLWVRVRVKKICETMWQVC